MWTDLEGDILCQNSVSPVLASSGLEPRAEALAWGPGLLAVLLTCTGPSAWNSWGPSLALLRLPLLPQEPLPLLPSSRPALRASRYGVPSPGPHLGVSRRSSHHCLYFKGPNSNPCRSFLSKATSCKWKSRVSTSAVGGGARLELIETGKAH